MSVPLNEQIKQARESSGLSVTELAKLAGTSRAAIYGYESGSVSPSLETAQRVLACTGSHIVVVQTPIEAQPETSDYV